MTAFGRYACRSALRIYGPFKPVFALSVFRLNWLGFIFSIINTISLPILRMFAALLAWAPITGTRYIISLRCASDIPFFGKHDVFWTTWLLNRKIAENRNNYRFFCDMNIGNIPPLFGRIFDIYIYRNDIYATLSGGQKLLSSYGSSPNFSSTKSPVLKNSSRSCLLKYGAPCLPGRHRLIVIFVTRKEPEGIFFHGILSRVEQPFSVCYIARKSLAVGGGCRRTSQ